MKRSGGPLPRWRRAVFAYWRVWAAILTIAICAVSFIWAPHDPHLVNLSIRLQSPNAIHWLGTDALGRDVFSRLLHGGKVTLGLVLGSGILIFVIATPLGLWLGYNNQGRWQWLKESVLHACTAFPPIAYMIVFVGAWGNGLFPLVTALVTASVLRLVKLVKVRVEWERDRAYVQCAVACGASPKRVLLRHIAPNVRKDSLLFLSLLIADMILLITSFSFIGLGAGTQVIDWGGMILEGSEVSLLRPDLMFYPILLVFVSTFIFNKLGDDLRR